ncbi:MAG: DUF1998 domain-containing protein [Acidobacteriota bacterium]
MSRRPSRRNPGRRQRGRHHQSKGPEGEIRRSQVVGTYGPGALVDLLEHAVLVGGLDFWNYPNGPRPVIPEPRLRERLTERLARLDPPVHLSEDEPFLGPPAARDDAPAPWNGVQALEFPGWFVCQNTDCRALVGRGTLDLKNDRWHHLCDDGKQSPVVPVRFVAACVRGHVQDFPWVFFAHLGVSTCASPRLCLDEGASGDFSDIRVTCRTCGAHQPLSRARIRDAELPCRGRRPWLGDYGREDCDRTMRLLVRTATNAYFGQVESALSIPDPTREIEDRLESIWPIVKNAEADSLPVLRSTIDSVAAALEGYSDEDVLTAIAARRADRTVGREPLRVAEMRQLLQSPRERPGEVADPELDFFARRIEPPADYPAIAGLVLVHKLRTVRAQVGFTRLEAPTPDADGEVDLGVESQRLGLDARWLPASEVRGEGVWITLGEARVCAWEDRPAVIERDRELRAGFDAWTSSRQARSIVYPGIRYYLLHSFSHLLMSAIALDCGYPSASISERLYCASRAADLPMAAILLSTGSAGAEGTLGGLVEEGRRLGRHIERALRMGSLCSNDPVCGGHSPAADHGERHLEGAACHGCLFVAEPSCEQFNVYLDRALVVPTLGQDPDLAFFEAP